MQKKHEEWKKACALIHGCNGNNEMFEMKWIECFYCFSLYRMEWMYTHTLMTRWSYVWHRQRNFAHKIVIDWFWAVLTAQRCLTKKKAITTNKNHIFSFKWHNERSNGMAAASSARQKTQLAEKYQLTFFFEGWRSLDIVFHHSRHNQNPRVFLNWNCIKAARTLTSFTWGW